MAIKVLGKITQNEDNSWAAPFARGIISLSARYDPDAEEPQRLESAAAEKYGGAYACEFADGGYAGAGEQIWAYGGYAILLNSGRRRYGHATVTQELILQMKASVIRYEKRMRQLQRMVELSEGCDDDSPPLRERIPDSVRVYVWRRDSGKCVQCGGREKLEFDHIIPVSKGGSNTERNIQLLCEACNRSKGADIAGT